MQSFEAVRLNDTLIPTHDFTQSPAGNSNNSASETDMLISTHDPSRLDTEHLGAESELDMQIPPRASFRVDAVVIRQRENTSAAYSSRLARDMSDTHSESTLQSFVTFSQKPQTENHKLSDFVRFCAITRWFLKLTVAFMKICVILDKSTGLIPCYFCEVVAKFKFGESII